ncbi:DUF2291 family protein [uncultured Sphaerochaeta sp.]|uniref:DUF2291 family protein n=1 Tax=uncultured Sphaerochaeta sp. TaxID=886478 RepID=UPI002A0A9719|nr:DUF2291 family protein [uncultured Sphaerochaeta sp.]
MKNKIKLIISIIVILGFIWVAIGTSHVVPLDEKGNPLILADEQSEDYLEGRWDTILEEIDDNTIELTSLLQNGNGNFIENIDDFGSGSKNILTVSGTAQIESVNTDSRAGFLTIKPIGYIGEYTFRLQIGPIFKGSTIRDGLSSIGFSDFDNQMDWSSLSGEIMEKLYDSSIAQLEFSSTEGKMLDFIGCFALDANTKTVVISPVRIVME